MISGYFKGDFRKTKPIEHFAVPSSMRRCSYARTPGKELVRARLLNIGRCYRPSQNWSGKIVFGRHPLHHVTITRARTDCFDKCELENCAIVKSLPRALNFLKNILNCPIFCNISKPRQDK